MRAALQKIIDQYNLNAPAYKKVYRPEGKGDRV